MIPVSRDVLRLGEITEREYFSERGELLISKGVEITHRHLEMLRRRSIFDLYVKDDGPTAASAQTGPGGTGTAPAPPAHVPPLADLGIKPGKEGLEQLRASSLAIDLDRRIKEGHTFDRPVGPPLVERVTEASATERTDDYKSRMQEIYGLALRETARLLDGFASGEIRDARSAREVSSRLVTAFTADRNILLNLSRTKHTGIEHLYTHALNVCLLSIAIGTASGYSENQVVEIGMGALLHDLGMLLVPAEIRNKHGKLSEEEWYEVLKHPVLGLHLLDRVRQLPESVPYVAYQTHERGNASGYPKRRPSALIHRFAKLVQVADVYEAMSSPRPHREPAVPYKAMENLIKMTRTGFLSEEFVRAFLSYISLFPVGSFVQLSDGRMAKVVASNPRSAAKPVVGILADVRGNLFGRGSIQHVDLYTSRDLQIAKALSVDYLDGVSLMDGF